MRLTRLVTTKTATNVNTRITRLAFEQILLLQNIYWGELGFVRTFGNISFELVPCALPTVELSTRSL